MLVLLSPAKKLDFESETLRSKFTQPTLLDETKVLAKTAKTMREADLKNLMGISDKLAELNVARFKAFTTPFTLGNAKQAIDAFKGDVYQGLNAETLSDDAIDFTQSHVRILSGLYGILRPLDLMQPYRLEMGIRFQNERGRNLYQFWGSIITEQLNNDLDGGENAVVINLASNEYFKAIKGKLLQARVITPVFKEIKDGKPPKIISFLAKKARGLMTRYIIENRIDKADKIKDFCVNGYAYDEEMSTGDSWVFVRNIP